MRDRLNPIQIRIMLGMLHASPWRYYPLSLQYLSSTYAQLSVGKACLRILKIYCIILSFDCILLTVLTYLHAVGMLSPPDHIRPIIAPMSELPSCLDEDKDSDENKAGDDVSTDNDKGGDSDAGDSSVHEDSTRLFNVDEDDDECLIVEDPSAQQNKYSNYPSSTARYLCGSAPDLDDVAVTLALDQDGEVEHGGGGSSSSTECFICQGVPCGIIFSKDIMNCPCGSHFHIECLHARWMAESEACGRTNGTDSFDWPPLPTGTRKSSGLIATSQLGLAIDGQCPCCLRKHTWVEMLQVRLTHI